MQDLVAGNERIERQDWQTTETLKAGLEQAGIEYLDISGRPKLYGIYQKMQQQKEFHEIYDLAASWLRPMRNAIVLWQLFTMPFDRFQAGLRTTLVYPSLTVLAYLCCGISGRPLEVQLRTLEMHQVAEYGIAAHWKYKETGSSNYIQLTGADDKFTWLRQLLEWQNDLKDAQEYGKYQR